MGLNKKPYKGTRDFFPKDKRVRDYMFKVMKDTAESFGYESYDGPLIEEVELYKAKSGEELINDQIYSFTDRGDRFVAIRPEMTPTVARMVAQVHREVSKPIRWFSIPNLYRYERPQKGRLREHWQFNIDIFGAPELLGEVEVIDLIATLLKNFGADSKMFEVQLNDRSIVNLVFSDLMGLDDEITYRMYKIVDKSKKVSREALEDMVEKTGINDEQSKIFFNYIALSSFDELIGFLKENNAGNIVKRMTDLVQLLKDLGLNKYCVYDPTIVRGLDYYTGIVFEVFDKHPDNKRAICGGGTYANLLKIFNEEALPGVGFGLGDVTLKDFLVTHDLLPEHTQNKVMDIFFTFQSIEATSYALQLSNEMRKLGLKVQLELSPMKFKKIFKEAEKNGARYVAFLDQKELDDKKFQLKNMITKEAHIFDFKKVNQIKKLFN